MQTEVLYDEYNTNMVSATMVHTDEGESSKKLKLEALDNKLQISVFDALEQEEELLSLNKKEVLQLLKLIGDISRPIKMVEEKPVEPIEPETPPETENGE